MHCKISIFLLSASSLLITSCDRDFFIDRDDCEVVVSAEALPCSGGSTTIHFGTTLSGDSPYASVYRIENGEYIPVFFNNSIEVSDARYHNDAISLISRYDAEANTVYLTLEYNYYTTPMAIVVDQWNGYLTNTAEIKLEPAPLSQLKSVTYPELNDSYQMSVESGKQHTFSFINATRQTQTFDLGTQLRSQCFFDIPDKETVRSIIGDEEPVLPVPVYNGFDFKLSDESIPFFTDAYELPDYIINLPDEFRFFEAPPLTLLQVSVTYDAERYMNLYTAEIRNGQIAEPMTVSGLFNQIIPKVLSVGSHAYDLETGEEVAQ